MGKKRAQVRQVKKTMRQVKPKPASTGAANTQQRKQRERYVEAGGFLQGYSPDWVIRLGYYSAAAIVVSLLVMVELIFGPIAPRSLPVRIVAAIAWFAPIVSLVSPVAPGVRLAVKDPSAHPRVVPGRRPGASGWQRRRLTFSVARW